MDNNLSKYLTDLASQEEPLVGLLGKPAEDFSEEELRDFVREQRSLRESRQSFKAAVLARSKGETPEPKSSKLFDSF